MAESYVWAVDEEGNPCKCFAKPENRGKGKCNHLQHAEPKENARDFLNRLEKEEKKKAHAKKYADTQIDNEKNIKEFEDALKAIDRPGMDKVLEYCQEHDMYTAPSSTKFHLSVEGGLLQHSLNVYNSMKDMLDKNDDGTYSYKVNGVEIDRISEDSLKVMTLLHDFCKMDTYKGTERTKKVDGKEVKYTTWKYDEKFSYGHGDKSVLLLNRMIELSDKEILAIRYHMGSFLSDDARSFTKAVSEHPIIWALHSADMVAASFIEGRNSNHKKFK